MWSPDRRTLAALALALALGGCADVRPLYGTMGASGGVQEVLQQIGIADATDRVGLKIRNELVFTLNGGTEPSAPRYRLDIRHTDGAVAVGAEKYQNLPAATVVQIDAGFQLSEIATGRVVFQGTSFATASYNYSSQRFANTRARLDAQDRVAQVVATDIRTKLAAWLATHPNP